MRKREQPDKYYPGKVHSGLEAARLAIRIAPASDLLRICEICDDQIMRMALELQERCEQVLEARADDA